MFLKTQYNSNIKNGYFVIKLIDEDLAHSDLANLGKAHRQTTDHFLHITQSYLTESAVKFTRFAIKSHITSKLVKNKI